jgi:FkbM family methyltransferase
VVTSASFASYSQNGEDVVLWRALRGVTQGRYIDVGANHPHEASVTMAFYGRGWSGITIEPDPEFAQLQRQARPRDHLVEAAITTEDGGEVTFHVIDGTGLSTLDDDLVNMHALSGHSTHDIVVPTRRLDAILQEQGWGEQEIHFMSVDTEGSERGVLESINLKVWRPWVLVIEATMPNSTRSTREEWEDLVLAAGYRFCLFDGLSCFYVANECRDQLAHALSYSACVLDNYTTPELRACQERAERFQKQLEMATQQAEQSERQAAMIPALIEDTARWRAQAMTRWATAVARLSEVAELRAQVEVLERECAKTRDQYRLLGENAAGLHKQIAELHGSTSWRVTRPLRAASGLLGDIRHSP